jgi:hypothetical protein
MISDFWDSASLANWQDSQRRLEPDSETTDITDLADRLTRVLAWLAEAETIERLGMRTAILLYCVRPDFLPEQSLRLISGTTKQNLSKMVTDFKGTFSLRPSVNQVAKTVARNSKV